MYKLSLALRDTDGGRLFFYKPPACNTGTTRSQVGINGLLFSCRGGCRCRGGGDVLAHGLAHQVVVVVVILTRPWLGHHLVKACWIVGSVAHALVDDLAVLDHVAQAAILLVVGIGVGLTGERPGWERRWNSSCTRYRLHYGTLFTSCRLHYGTRGWMAIALWDGGLDGVVGIFTR